MECCVGWTAEQILNLLVERNFYRKYGLVNNPTYIIMGRTGPTGKSWLCHELNAAGRLAFEIAEETCCLVEYMDDRNRVIANTDHIVVILNETLPMYRGKGAK